MGHRHAQYPTPYFAQSCLLAQRLSDRRVPGRFQLLPGQQSAVTPHSEQLTENVRQPSRLAMVWV
jgi:hypothetical protein